MNPSNPLNILLAEDECSVAFSISFALKADGHKIEIVNDGEEALSEITRKPGAFDLLITDHSMPRMNGVELVKQLRDTAFRGKIVVLSAHLSAENRAAYLTLGWIRWFRSRSTFMNCALSSGKSATVRQPPRKRRPPNYKHRKS